MEPKPAITGMLGLVLVTACAGTSVHSGQNPQDSVPAAAAVGPRCVRQAQVTVHVENQSGLVIGVFFGSTHAKTSVGPFSKTKVKVTRFYLESPIRLAVGGGGLTDRPASIPTEPVACNDATLVIGPRPSQSTFVGDVLRRPSGDSGR